MKAVELTLALLPAGAATSPVLAQGLVHLANDLTGLAVNDQLVVAATASIDDARNDTPALCLSMPVELAVNSLEKRPAAACWPSLMGHRTVSRNGSGKYQLEYSRRATTVRARGPICQLVKCSPAVFAAHSFHALIISALITPASSVSCGRPCHLLPEMAGRTRTEEEAMPEPRNGGVKTLAIRLPDDLHAQLSLVAQLDELTLTDTIRRAIEEFIDRKRAEGDFAARAAAMLEEIDREAATRRQSIEALFGKNGPPEGSGEQPKGRSRGKSDETNA